MPITVRIPTPLRTLTKGADEVTVEGENIKDLIDNLEANYKGIKERICDSDGQIRRFINFYLNDEDIRFMGDLNTPTKDGDHISIVPAIAGGNYNI
ncbi:MAG: MoaD/ThiS family protein [wastewater metagenome]|nr:MoaD/ThiS family protein [Candidatus Loosdrechtia aerotolerans]